MKTTATNAKETADSMATQQSSSRRNTEYFELSQRFYFEAAHTLHRTVETEGSLRIHGHTYEAEITVCGLPNHDSGMIVDLTYLKREISRVRELLDHRLLDEVRDLGPATLENLCQYIRRQLEDALPSLSAVLVERKISGDRCVLRCVIDDRRSRA